MGTTGGPGITGPRLFTATARLGLGYFYYDPFWAGYPGYGYCPYGGYYGGPAATTVAAVTTAAAAITGGAVAGYGSSGGSGYYGTGHLRLKVKPRDAEVYVDGYFAGSWTTSTARSRSWSSRPVRTASRYERPGSATMTFEVRILADESVTYRGELNPLP